MGNTIDASNIAEPSTREKQPVSGVSLTPSLQGWRLKTVLVSIFIGFFLSILDTTIVSVALPTIATRFNDFDHSTWVINAYLLTYMAFSIIISRMSDIFGRMAIEVMAFILFMVFSMACALSRTMTQLIIFRAFQGIGGSAMFSSCMVIAMSSIPSAKMHLMSAATSVCMVSAGVAGPLLGGAITRSIHQNTWPWVFWINLPLAGAALVAFLIAWPSDKSRKTFTWTLLTSIDFFGSMLLLAASILLVFALEEAGAYILPWRSAPIVVCLILSGIFVMIFIAWQRWLTDRPHISVKVVFPVKLMVHRVVSSAILTTALSGFVYYTAIVNLPEHFQIVSRDSPLMAGVRLLPMLVASAMGSISGGMISRKRNNTSFTLIAAAAFQVLGYGLMSTIGYSTSVPARQYGFQVFLGLGFGLTVASVTQMTSIQVEPRWLAVTQGALAQMRTLGGSIGLAVAVIISNGNIRSSRALETSLSSTQMIDLFHSPLVISDLKPQQQVLVAEAFAQAFKQQMRVATFVAAASFVTSLGTFQRHPPQRRRPPQSTTEKNAVIEDSLTRNSVASRETPRLEAKGSGYPDSKITT